MLHTPRQSILADTEVRRYRDYTSALSSPSGGHGQLTLDTVNLASVTSFLEEITDDYACVEWAVFGVDTCDLG
jgi:hypothetical protein